MTYNNDLEWKPASVLMGRQTIAKYNEQKINSYKNNPLIEALPDIFTQQEVVSLLTETPKVNVDETEESPEIRMHLIQQVKHHFMQPMPIHIEIEMTLSLMIRTGYKGRNPVSPLYARQFAVGVSEILKGNYDNENGNIIGNRSTASSYSIIGISGIGKSTAIEKVLLLYPQVIIHSDYEYNGLSIGYLKQIVWLVIECPFNASRGSLCKNFFMAVDNILGTNYYKQFVKLRLNESDLIDKMAHVAALHCIGVLVFDEIQRMKKGEEGKQTMNFFVELHNKLGVPIIFVGTYKSMDLFTPLLANARRASGMGVTFFDRMEKDKKWDLFINRLWKHQWLKNFSPITEEFNEMFYKETQGITDLVVNLFLQAQLFTLSIGKEQLTPKIIKQVATKSLKIFQPYLKALESGDIELLKKFEDLKPEWTVVDTYLKNLPGQAKIEGSLKKEHENAISNAVVFVKHVEFAKSLGLSKKQAVEIVSEVLDQNKVTNDNLEINKLIAKKILIANEIEQKISKNKKIDTFDKTYLHVVGLKALNEKKSLEDQLKKLNVIKSFDEFIS